MLHSIQCDAIRLYRDPETADLKNKKRKWIAGRSPSPFYVLAYTPESVLAPIQGPSSREHVMKKRILKKITPLSVSLFFISLGCVFSLLQVGEKMNSPDILKSYPPRRTHLPSNSLVFDDVTPLRHVETVKELEDEVSRN